MTRTLQRVETAAQVDAIAKANHVEDYTHTAYAASVTLGGVVYWWVAARRMTPHTARVVSAAGERMSE